MYDCCCFNPKIHTFDILRSSNVISSMDEFADESNIISLNDVDDVSNDISVADMITSHDLVCLADIENVPTPNTFDKNILTYTSTEASVDNNIVNISATPSSSSDKENNKMYSTPYNSSIGSSKVINIISDVILKPSQSVNYKSKTTQQKSIRMNQSMHEVTKCMVCNFYFCEECSGSQTFKDFIICSSCFNV